MAVNRTPVLSKVDFTRLQHIAAGLRRATGYESRLHQVALLELLDGAEIVDPDRVPGNVVTVGAEVAIRDLERRDNTVYTFVWPHEADIRKLKVSVITPLGLSVLGRYVGERVEFDTPGGRRRIRIAGVVRPSEGVA